LQEQRVLLIAVLQQHDERPGADAAGTDDLAGEVDDLELLQQMPSILLPGGPRYPPLCTTLRKGTWAFRVTPLRWCLPSRPVRG
jgi:hypothetical protein